MIQKKINKRCEEKTIWGLFDKGVLFQELRKKSANTNIFVYNTDIYGMIIIEEI